MKNEKYRKRQPITELANRGQGGVKTTEDAIKFIDKIADFKIRQDLLAHLKECDFELEKAFSNEGIEEFNSKRKIPVYKVPIAESGSGRFAVGNTVGTKHKWVEADKGTNLFFVIYERKDTKERMYDTIPLNEVIEHQKRQVEEGVSKENRLAIPIKNYLELRGKDVEVEYLFHLSPNDLVYVPTEDELENESSFDFNNFGKEQTNKVYKMVSSTGSECHFIRANISSLIKIYDAKSKIGELGSLNKMELDLENIIRIKTVCIKLKIDRLGNISKA